MRGWALVRNYGWSKTVWQPEHKSHQVAHVCMDVLTPLVPTQPGSDINMYMQLVKEELDTLWDKKGVSTWDAYKKEYFDMRAVCHGHYLGLGYVSSQVCHGHYACVKCMDERAYRHLSRLGHVKPCTSVIRGGLTRMTRGEKEKTYSPIQLRPEDRHVREKEQRFLKF